MLYKTCLIVLLAAAFPSMARADCSGTIGSGTAVSGQTPYDPFKASDTGDEQKLRIRNTGDEACGFAIAFRTPDGSAKLGGLLSYVLTSANGRALLVDATAGVPAAAQLPGPVAVNGTADFAYRVVIPRGQFAGPGNYAGTLTLELYAIGSGGKPGSTPVDSTTLHISYAVPQMLSVNIKGAGTTTTVDFEEMTVGEQRSVIVQARANQYYSLDVESDHHGVMVLTPAAPGQNWSIGYETRLDGQLLDLNRGASVNKLLPTPGDEANHNLLVTVGDVSKKRAGKYEDVITVRISGAAH